MKRGKVFRFPLYRQPIKKDGQRNRAYAHFEAINFNMNVLTGFLCYFLFLHVYTVAQLPEDYYKKKEAQVKKMADEILKLDGARCEWAANCSSSTCSRHACTPIGGFDDANKYNFTCQIQNEPNQYCSSSTGPCKSRQVNYAMSYVRMAPSPISMTTIPPVTEEMCSTICMTRDFTSTMKDLASENNYANEVDELFYFGSIDGVARFYPGEELNDQDAKCYSYDPRTRPWYNGAISLPTYLIVLIDNSNSANIQINSPSLNTAFKEAQKMVKKLIYTPSAGDMLDVIAFNETNATAVTQNPVSIQDDSELGEFQDGRKNLSQLIDGIPKTSDNSVAIFLGGFKQAISIALLKMKDSSSRPNKVILVFTNGGFASSLQLADRQPVSAMLKSNFTKLFIYSFDKSLNLEALAKESDGYYETIVDNFDNPLYQISSFFNFMALTRNASGNEPHWTKFYKDAEGRGNITTVSYQALSQVGHLVGVVAIDIIFKPDQGKLPSKAGNRPTPSTTHDVHTEGTSSTSAGQCDLGSSSAVRDKGKRILGFTSLMTTPSIPEEEEEEMPQVDVVYENIQNIPPLPKTYIKSPAKMKRKREDEDLSEPSSAAKRIDFNDQSTA
ncbi:uncharacterized protein LOC131033072 isoform X1 [Cryptomeria japonica]|uniref:uncharacterized protein LOC131033072 isoform X1 n=1 Tax=Cryptomeria japonica TaxID=3369 RepID=UPI0027DAA2A5|nr:uncharacterized protein LOC131033072 isoform X1 [Cryptomeria japonica]